MFIFSRSQSIWFGFTKQILVWCFAFYCFFVVFFDYFVWLLLIVCLFLFYCFIVLYSHTDLPQVDNVQMNFRYSVRCLWRWQCLEHLLMMAATMEVMWSALVVIAAAVALMCVERESSPRLMYSSLISFVSFYWTKFFFFFWFSLYCFNFTWYTKSLLHANLFIFSEIKLTRHKLRFYITWFRCWRSWSVFYIVWMVSLQPFDVALCRKKENKMKLVKI